MSRDPRVNLLIHGLPVDRPNYAGDGPNYATIAGTVELTDDPDGAFHQEMYGIHMGGATPPPEPGAQRVIVRIVPDASTSRRSRHSRKRRDGPRGSDGGSRSLVRLQILRWTAQPGGMSSGRAIYRRWRGGRAGRPG